MFPPARTIQLGQQAEPWQVIEMQPTVPGHVPCISPIASKDSVDLRFLGITEVIIFQATLGSVCTTGAASLN
jgi:hypothetical protein